MTPAARPVFLLVLLLGLVPAAALAAAPRLQVYFAADFHDTAYQQETYRKVAAAWKRPAATPAPGSKAVVLTTILKDGAALPPTLHFESGSEAWDAAALDAVARAAPFKPLPKAYRRDSVEVHFHFEYARQ